MKRKKKKKQKHRHGQNYVLIFGGQRMVLSGVLSSCMLSHVQLFVTSLTVAHQASLSMGFSKQEYCSGLPFPPPGDLPDPGTEPMSPESPALAGEFFTTEPPGKSVLSGNGAKSITFFIFFNSKQP